MPLRSSEANSLLPLFEAISNSLHAIQEKFGENQKISDFGEIIIRILRDNTSSENEIGQIIGFEITDNGIGLTDKNYKSFLTPFSRLKITRGGKGVGRLGWLKVFENITVYSLYEQNGSIGSRKFRFILRETDQIDPVEVTSSDRKDYGTVVHLENFKGSFASKCPVNAYTIAQRIIAHFLPIFAGDSSPIITLIDDATIDLKKEFLSKIVRSSEEIIDINLDGENIPFLIRHMQCDKSIRPRGRNHNWLCFCADERGVREFPIDEQLGLKLLEGGEIYVGTVTSNFLNGHVNPQRTDFTFDPEDGKEIRRRVAASVRAFLSKYIEESLARKRQITKNIIQKNPQYL